MHRAPRVNRLARARATYAAIAVLVIAVGLAVHRGNIVPPDVRDKLGDALWASMIFFWISALRPTSTISTRAVAATSVCFLVEGSQLLHAPFLDALRRTPVGHLVLGSGFDVWDLAAYVVGVVVAAALARALHIESGK
jgi:hypothetical protein